MNKRKLAIVLRIPKESLGSMVNSLHMKTLAIIFSEPKFDSKVNI
jgi:hypothetical protein